MENTPQLTGLLAFITYLLSAALLLYTKYRHGPNACTRAPRLFAWVALLLHGVSIYTVMVTHEGLMIGLFQALSLTSLLVVCILLVVSIWQPLEVFGVLLFPVASLCAIGGSWVGDQVVVIDMELQWHILISVMAYSVLALAATQSMVLAVQTHYLRTLQPAGILSALPPIERMEKLLFQMIGAGFVLLSLSLFTGVLFLQDISAQHLVHKTTLSIMAWLIFGTLLAGRVRWGWRGKTALAWTLSGLGFLIVGYFGSKLVLEFILVR